VVSDCASRYLTRLLSAALNVKHFKTGIHTKLTDQDVLCVLERNQLARLESWTVPASSLLTLATANLLLTSCPNLRSIQDLNYWSACTPEKVERFREMVQQQNLEMEVGVRLADREVQRHLDDLNEDLVNYLRGVSD